MTKIRAYTTRDWEAVRAVYDLSKLDEMKGSVNLEAILPLRADQAALTLFSESVILVAEDGGEVIGFGGHKGNYISWLFVHPAHRRKGIARALLNEIFGRLKGAITLDVAAENHAARRLYLGFGFIATRQFAGKFNGHDVDVLTLTFEQVPNPTQGET